MTKADKFTAVRLVFAPFLFLLYMIPVWTGKCAALTAVIMLPLLIFAEITDYLDGHYARKENQVSDFGKMFDPFADVMLHLTAFICYAISGYMPVFLLVLIFYREFCMLFIRLIAVSKGTHIAARKGGKAKTVIYVVGIIYCLLLESVQRFGLDLSEYMIYAKWVAYCLFGIGTIASYLSFIDYLKNFGKLLKN